jgi:hypothetical protein
MGPSGGGKTTALATYAKAGVETFCLITEPGGVDSLIDAAKIVGAPMDKLHWATVMPATEGWKALDEMVKDIGSKDFEAISKIKGIGKEQTRNAAMKLLENLKLFDCERCGKTHGDFTSFNHNQALVMDSLSGLSTIAWYLTVGYKPTGAPGEWNIAQNFIDALLLKINSDRKCFFTLTAHVEKETDELTGVNKIMVSTLGRKLAPKIPRYFGEVIYATRTLNKDGKYSFNWSTVDGQIELKNRALPVSHSLPPDFGQIVSAYKRRLSEAGIVDPGK